MISQLIYDFVIVGAGMAGASTAHFLADNGNVLLLEMESHPGYHSTGRSAALFSEAYGNGPIRALTSSGQPIRSNLCDLAAHCSHWRLCHKQPGFLEALARQEL